MLSDLVERVKTQITIKTSKEMEFRSEFARANFEVIRENSPDSAKFVESWAKLMQKNMGDEITSSVLMRTYQMVNECRKAGMDFHHAFAILASVWNHGDKIVKDKSA